MFEGRQLVGRRPVDGPGGGRFRKFDIVLRVDLLERRLRRLWRRWRRRAGYRHVVGQFKHFYFYIVILGGADFVGRCRVIEPR